LSLTRPAGRRRAEGVTERFVFLISERKKPQPALSIGGIAVRRSFEAANMAALNRRTSMRVIVMVKATKNSEAGIMPSEELLTKMGKFNEELVRAGVLLAGDGLHPSRKGKRLRFSGGQKTVYDGPFAETKELVAGYWVWQVKSIEEAVEWARRCPDPMPGEEAELEIRPVFEIEDFGANATPEIREHNARLQAEVQKRSGT
jgi:hypothetical protein